MNTSIAASTAGSVKITDILKPSEDAIAEPEFNLSAGNPDQFPIHVFPPILRSVADEMAKVYQTPICMPAMATLAALSGSVGKSAVVLRAYRDKITPLNIYVIEAAERGTGKGNIGEITRPIIDRSRELADRDRAKASDRKAEFDLLEKEILELRIKAAHARGSEHANQLEALKVLQRKADELKAGASRETTLWISDCTSQKVARALADNDEALFSNSSEAGGVVKVILGRYNDGKGDFDFYLSAYSGEPIRVDRIGRDSLELQAPCLSLLWLVQPSVLSNLLKDEEAFSRGLTARILIFDTGARREHDNGLNLAFNQGETWSVFLNGVIDRRLSGMSPTEIGCDVEARKIFAKFDSESIDLEREHFPELTGESTRWRENAIKVAGLFAVAEGVETITADLAERAVAVVRWCGFNYFGLLKAGKQERLREKRDRVLELIYDNDGKINLGPLAASHKIKRPEIQSLVAAFPDCLEIVRTPPTGPGRPQEFVQACSKSSLSS